MKKKFDYESFEKVAIKKLRAGKGITEKMSFDRVDRQDIENSI